jgi:purine-binding chemotaxis protein CheW
MERTKKIISVLFIGGVQMQNTKLAIFKIGDEDYGFDIMEVTTIEKYMPINRVTNSPQNMIGVMRLREKIIPVYSLRRKFGLKEKKYDDNTRYMITISNGIPIAYEVDDMKHIISIDSEKMNDIPPLVKTQETSYIKYITNVNDQLVVVLDNNKIITENEQKILRAIIKSVQ